MSQLFLTKPLLTQLIKNGREQEKYKMEHEGETIDFKPVVKFFNPCGSATWLISEIDPDNTDIMFGLCDLGMGFPELGDVSITEMKSIKLPFGLKIERDYHFKPQNTMAVYAEQASNKGRITGKNWAFATDMKK